MSTQDTHPSPVGEGGVDLQPNTTEVHKAIEEPSVPISWDRKLYVLFVTTLAVMAMFYIGTIGSVILLAWGLMSYWGEPLDPPNRKLYRHIYLAMVSTITLLLVARYDTFLFLPLLFLMGGEKLIRWLLQIWRPTLKLVLIILVLLVGLAHKPLPFDFCKRLDRWKRRETSNCKDAAEARVHLRSEAWHTTKRIVVAVLSIFPEPNGKLSRLGEITSYVIVIGLMLPGAIYGMYLSWETAVLGYNLFVPFLLGTLASIRGGVIAIENWQFWSLFGEVAGFVKLALGTVWLFIAALLSNLALNATLHFLGLVALERLYEKSERFRNWWHRTFSKIKSFLGKNKDWVVGYFNALPRLVRAVLVVMMGPFIILLITFVWVTQAVRLFILKKAAIAVLKKPILKLRKNEGVRKSAVWIGKKTIAGGRTIVKKIKQRRKPLKNGAAENESSA